MLCNLGGHWQRSPLLYEEPGFRGESCSHPDGPGDGFTTINAGPIARFPLEDGLTPFIHALVGPTRIGGPTTSAITLTATVPSISSTHMVGEFL